MSDELAATYLGLELRSPVIVGACPLTLDLETVRQLVGAGAGAIVLPSMLQEQIVHRIIKPSDPLGAIARSGYQPQQDRYNGGADAYLQTISLLKKNCAVPVIASLNGTSEGQWLDYAKEIESAGADAIEFNLQQAVSDAEETSDHVEARFCDMIRQVKVKVTIPVAAKISQRYTNLASMARQLAGASADGVVLFTHLPQWDVSIDRMHWTIHWELSPVDSLGGILDGIVRVRRGGFDISIAASGGVASAEDAIKTMIAGADVVMVTSAVYREGPDAIRKMVDGIEQYLDISPYSSLREFQQARPKAEVVSERMMRLEYVDPLTRSVTYYDPTPMPSQVSGDAYGHQK